MQTVIQQVFKRVKSEGNGYVFTPSDFLNIGNRAAVDQALSRLARSGKIRRIRRGLYDLPQVSPRFGILSPVPHKVAQAMARKTGSRLLPSGAQAANALGLSSQVAAKPVYITDGPNQTITIGRQTIQLRHVPARYFLGSRGADLAIHVLRYLGRNAVSTADVKKLRTTLSDRDRRALYKSIHSMPSWMAPHIKQIAQPA